MSKLVSSHWWSVFFVLFFPLLIMYIYSDFIRSSELNARFGWLILLGGLAYMFRHTILQKILLGVIFLFAMSGSMDIVYAVTFGGVFVSATFEALALTDTHEALEFLQAYISLENVLILLLYWTIAFYSLKKILFKEVELTREKVFAGLGVLMVLVAIQQINDRGRTFDVIPGFTGVAIDYSSSHQAIEEIIHARQDMFTNNDFKAELQSNKPQTYVVVLGESLGRKHMSLYGYDRKTTPILDSLKSETIIFEDAISVFAQTKPSLSVNLTQADTVNKKRASESISLVGVFKRAGFKTFWVSNQQPLRVPTKPMAMIADEQYFISHDFHGVEANRYDGYMLPTIQKVLKDPAKHKVVFVHLMGSHLQYKNRYPSEKTVFKGNDGIKPYTTDISNSQLDFINAYDNSVHYTDYVLGEIINQLQKSEDIAGLTFWADHGEEVFDVKDFKGHGPDGVTSSMLEVPYFFWRNEAYKTEFSERDKLLLSHVKSPIMLDDFFHMAQCFVPVMSDLLIQEKSLCLANYDVKSRFVYGKNYDKGLK
ncbi:phosphoethanolamine transferase [Thiomicrorhabdus lithotrophica]|uniref:Phosphoethanolamine transferase n=1 Tax=Thiomicrorhabdus lithotrophica TaxID=2949997 RepID=A0ABY8CDD1_9GAMM|nr:phosphoethanolamine transferase [Thiomicrorhabdus lithotrophica]WEJ62133.1 phosphoethanolamine transferase [Thiomicrorhabdus lithotrophica]